MKIKTFLTAIMTFCMANAWSQSTLITQPDSALGKDAYVFSLATHVNFNYGNNAQLTSSAWTWSGNLGINRSLIEFDISAISTGTQIHKAELCLFGAADLITGGHSQLSGSNEIAVQRITSEWDEHSVNWSTQPTTTDKHMVTTDASANDTIDYVINVTDMVQDMVDNPETSHGFLIKQVTEEYYRRMNFASSDYHNAAKHPKLKIVYGNDTVKTYVTVTVFDTVPVFDTLTVMDTTQVFDTVEVTVNIPVYDTISVTDTLYIDVTLTSSNEPELKNRMKIYPNPTKNIINIDNGNYSEMGNYSIKILNLSGQTLFESQINEQMFQIDVNTLGATGLYFVQLIEGTNTVEMRKLILE